MKKLGIFFVVIFLFSGLTGCGKTWSYSSRDYSFKTPIKSLGLKTESKGAASTLFTIGYAVVGESTYYYVYEQVEEDKYLLQKYNAEDTYIRETDSNPHVEKYYRYIAIDQEAYMASRNIFTNINILIDNLEAHTGFGMLYTSDNDYYADLDNQVVKNYFKPVTDKLRDNEILAVTKPNITLNVPRNTIKVGYNADISNSK